MVIINDSLNFKGKLKFLLFSWIYLLIGKELVFEHECMGRLRQMRERGRIFPRASARRCLTFPHGVYSAHRLSSRSFSLRPDVRDLPTAPPVDGKLLIQLLYYRVLPTPPRFRFMAAPSAAPILKISYFIQILKKYLNALKNGRLITFRGFDMFFRCH